MPLPRVRMLKGLVMPPCRMLNPGVQVSLPTLHVRLALLHPPLLRNSERAARERLVGQASTACRRLQGCGLLEPRVPNDARRNWTTACRRLLLEPRLPNEARLAPRDRPLELSSSTCHRLRIREVLGNGGTGERIRLLQLVRCPCHCEHPGLASSLSNTRAASRFSRRCRTCPLLPRCLL